HTTGQGTQPEDDGLGALGLELDLDVILGGADGEEDGHGDPVTGGDAADLGTVAAARAAPAAPAAPILVRVHSEVDALGQHVVQNEGWVLGVRGGRRVAARPVIGTVRGDAEVALAGDDAEAVRPAFVDGVGLGGCPAGPHLVAGRLYLVIDVHAVERRH